jgi:hypothetical protein
MRKKEFWICSVIEQAQLEAQLEAKLEAKLEVKR